MKGRDPMVFGRGAEKAEFLRGKDINFEIVPGVSAAFAGPTAAGIPVTHRLLSSSVLVVAGHGSSDGTEQAKVDWKKNDRAADTLAILMGAGIFREIASHLIRGGLNADTPVAAISWATTAKQSTILSTLGTLSCKSRTPRIRPPA